MTKMLLVRPPSDAVLFNAEQVAAALFKVKGINRGLWRLGLHLNFAGATHLWQDAEARTEEWMPTAYVGVSGVGIQPADAPGPMIFDAAKLNPPETKAKPARKKSVTAG